jgi:murein DD-endopeptidase MepM/ murein hydrolase activator NlpD
VATYYRNASVSIWDALDEITDPTERMYMERIINGVLDYDDNLIKEIKEEKKAIEDEKVRLEGDKVACNELKANLETKLAGLNETVEVRTKYMAQLETDAKLLERSIDEIQKKADELEAELKRIASSSTTSKYMGGTMQWPLPGYYTITSPFGMRMHPTLHVRKMHTGVDISGAGVNGKNVVAAADGKVITAGWLGGYGYAVMIDHGGGVVTLYGHSSKLLVKVGDKVKAGQTIMKVGTTGNSTGPHLHFEVRIDGKYVDPLNGYIKAK